VSSTASSINERSYLTGAPMVLIKKISYCRARQAPDRLRGR
jgi:hypothetical protein